MKGLFGSSPFVLLCLLFVTTNAFVLKPTIVVSSKKRLAPHQDRAVSEGEDVATTDEVVVDDLNKGRFLSEMDRSLVALEKQQKELLEALHTIDPSSNDRPVSKQDQIAKQYVPFQELAKKAANLNAKYKQEIADIRSRPTCAVRKVAFSKATKALSMLGAIIVGGLLIGSVLQTMPAIDDNLVTAPSSEAGQLVQVESPAVEQTSPLSPPVPEVMPYSLKDFSKLDLYGSVAQVEEWFSN